MKSWVDRALAILFSGFACPFVSLFFQWRADAGRLSDTQDRDAQVAALLKEVYTLRAMPAVVEDGPVREERRRRRGRSLSRRGWRAALLRREPPSVTSGVLKVALVARSSREPC